MAIHVKSEIGKLKRVMILRPGQELDHLVPEDLERLLFDDIPYLKTAKIRKVGRRNKTAVKTSFLLYLFL